MSYLPLTIERKAAFLGELSRHGIATRAARAASPHTDSPSGCLSTFKDERQRDGAFAEAWEEAVDLARAEIEHEIYRRGQEGVAEPVFGGRYAAGGFSSLPPHTGRYAILAPSPRET